MRKTYKIKLYRSKKNKHLHRTINLAGRAYNHCIALHRRYYKLTGKRIPHRRGGEPEMAEYLDL